MSAKFTCAKLFIFQHITIKINKLFAYLYQIGNKFIIHKAQHHGLLFKKG